MWIRRTDVWAAVFLYNEVPDKTTICTHLNPFWKEASSRIWTFTVCFLNPESHPCPASLVGQTYGHKMVIIP